MVVSFVVGTSRLVGEGAAERPDAVVDTWNGDANNYYKSWSTRQLLEALNQKGIRYPPTALRVDLERLLWQASHHAASPTTTRRTAPATTNNKKQCDATSSPAAVSATNTSAPERIDLERQQQQLRARRRRRRQHRTASTAAAAATKRPSGRPSVPSSWSQRVLQNSNLPNIVDRAKRKAVRIQRRAADFWAVDEDTGVRDVRYRYLSNNNKAGNHHHSPRRRSSTTKHDDDDVIDVPAQQVEVVVIPDDDGNDDGVKQLRQPRTSNGAERPQRDSVSVSARSSNNRKSTHPSSASSSPPSRRQHTRPRRSLQDDDDDGLYYREESPRRVVYRSSNGSNSEQPPSRPQRRPQRQQRPPSPPLKTAASHPSRSAPYFILPPPSTDSPQQHAARHNDIPFRSSYRRRQQQRSSPGSSRQSFGSNKKVYSPYINNHNHRSSSAGSGDAWDDNDRDLVDRVGEFLADTADSFMWGKYDDDDDIQEGDSPPTAPNGGKKKQGSRRSATTAASSQQQQSPQRSRTGGGRPKHARKHWKDRLEERLDSLLGIHEEGPFYNNWAERSAAENQRNSEAGGDDYDAFSVAQGRRRPKSRPRRRPKHRASSNPREEKPFWEQGNANPISMLFGAGGPANGGTPFFDDRKFGPEYGSVLTVVRTVLRSLSLVGGLLCRWASTQGALPQPVVVIGATAAGLCARPRRRLLAVGIALLLMRTVGEMLHGYTYGSQGWEYDDDVDDEIDGGARYDYGPERGESDSDLWEGDAL